MFLSNQCLIVYMVTPATMFLIWFEGIGIRCWWCCRYWSTMKPVSMPGKFRKSSLRRLKHMKSISYNINSKNINVPLLPETKFPLFKRNVVWCPYNFVCVFFLKGWCLVRGASTGIANRCHLTPDFYRQKNWMTPWPKLATVISPLKMDVWLNNHSLPGTPKGC